MLRAPLTSNRASSRPRRLIASSRAGFPLSLIAHSTPSCWWDAARPLISASSPLVISPANRENGSEGGAQAATPSSSAASSDSREEGRIGIRRGSHGDARRQQSPPPGSLEFPLSHAPELRMPRSNPVTIGTPLSPHATRVLLLGAGELGKEVAIELQRFGVEVIAADRYADAPAMQVAHRCHTLNMLDPA